MAAAHLSNKMMQHPSTQGIEPYGPISAKPSTRGITVNCEAVHYSFSGASLGGDWAVQRLSVVYSVRHYDDVMWFNDESASGGRDEADVQWEGDAW